MDDAVWGTRSSMSVAEFLRDEWAEGESAIRRMERIIRPFACAEVRRRRGLGSADVDDLVMLVLERCLARDGRILRRTSPTAPLAALLSRVLRLVAGEIVRSNCRNPVLTDSLDATPDLRPGTPEAASIEWEPTEEQRNRIVALVPGQRDAVLALLRTRSFKFAAAELGITEEALRERLARVAARSAGPAPYERIRPLSLPTEWIPKLPLRLRILVGLIERGRTRSQIARELRLSPESVRSAIRRLRRRIREHDAKGVAPPPRGDQDRK